MGIAGLLPALKSIQVAQHLSELSGKTVAVDAYVWLHKAIYSCATELATARPTRKYIDYAMHRVRLLRYYNIEPYIVFDGGPLPAKQGTELERKQRRAEYLTRGNALAAQGRHSQARECYVKCVDVTPQMAYQLIKALRAEGVAYVVAPYEADAQLAYLERIGLVDAILTEDSDLLVYGCKTVLFKLDTVEATVVSISRENFGSIAPPRSEISLIGWSDAQFRAMTILSGCDYLPSIPGVGLKTACSLLRKWKTVEQVVRVLVLEGKKSVPKDYLRRFQKAERCFLHQRVYCPLSEKLVHLTEINAEEWDEEHDDYVGRFIDPDSAQKIALGEIDPITHLLMNDIDPSYLPRPSKNSAHITRSRSHNGKGKAREVGEVTPRTGGLLKYFSPVTISQGPESLRLVTTPCAAKKGNGKRTLADVMEIDTARRDDVKQGSVRILAESKFFANIGNKKRPTTPSSTSPPCALPIEKENFFGDTDPSPGLNHCHTGKRKTGGSLDEATSGCPDGGDESIDLNVDREQIVQQEEGYISPPEMSGGESEAPELSSPVRPSKKRKARAHADGQLSVKETTFFGDEDDFEAETLSSPPAATKIWTASNIFKRWEYHGNRKANTTATSIERRHSFPLSSLQRAKTDINACVSVVDIKPTEKCAQRPLHSSHVMDNRPNPEDKPKGEVLEVFPGPNLFLDDVTEVEHMEEAFFDNPGPSSGDCSPAPSASPDTPADEALHAPDDRYDDLEILDEEQVRLAHETRTNIIMDGWRARWARQSPQPHPLSRTNSNSSRKMPQSQAVRSINIFRPAGLTAPGTASLKRNETNVTRHGRHSLKTTRPQLRHPYMTVGGRRLGDPCIDLTTEGEDH